MSEPAKKHIITIAGKPGSGKSTTAKAVAAELGFERFSSGELFRQLSAERGLDLLSGNFHAEKHSDIDHILDQRLRDIGANDDNLVIDSRMAWNWIPQSFKVYLDLDIQVAAKRILANVDEARAEAEHIPTDPAVYAKHLDDRLASEARRYHALYGVNPDTAEYDLVVDTASNNAEQSAALVVEEFRRWIAS